jgi:hypothetical protein
MASHPHSRLHRHSGAQPMVRIFTRIEANPDRQSLHYLDVVAGRVFGRQQTIEFASRAGQAFDVALVVASGSIDVNRYRLAAMLILCTGSRESQR